MCLCVRDFFITHNYISRSLFFFFRFILLQFVRNDRHETLCQQDPDCFTVSFFLLLFKGAKKTRAAFEINMNKFYFQLCLLTMSELQVDGNETS